MFTVKAMKQRREKLGLSKSALAREANMHVSTVSQIENGILNPYPGQEEKLEAALTRLENEKKLNNDRAAS